MPRPPGQKREPILAAALEAFVDSGFHGATIPRIAKQAGISPATCYLYFESKEALANELLRECLRIGLSYTAAPLDPDSPSSDAFRELWRQLLYFGRAHTREYLFLSRALYDSYLDDESRALLGEVHDRELASFARYESTGLLDGMSIHELHALVRGHARVLVERAAAGHIELTDELIERTGARTWAGLSFKQAG